MSGARKALGRIVTVAVALLAAVIVIAPPARAQTPPGTEGQFTYHPTEGVRGDSIFFDAKCLWGASGQGVELDVIVGQMSAGGSEFSQTYKVADDGIISSSIVVPSNAQSGDYVIAGNCRLQDQVFFTSQPGPFTVTGPPLVSSTTMSTTLASTTSSIGATSGRKLVRTGSDIRLLAIVSTGLALFGLVISIHSRRWRRG